MKRWLYIAGVLVVLVAIGREAVKAAASPDIRKLLGSARAGVPDISGAVGESAKGAEEAVKKLFGK